MRQTTGKLNIHAQQKICMERYFCTFLVSEFYTIEERSGLFWGIPEVELGTGAGIQELIVSSGLETEGRGIMASSKGLSACPVVGGGSKSGIFEKGSLSRGRGRLGNLEVTCLSVLRRKCENSKDGL